MNLLKNKQFLKLWSNQILLQISFNMTTFTALLLIDQVTNSRFAVGQFYAVTTIPYFIIGLFAGSVVDLTNRKRLMLIADTLLVILFFLYALFTHNYIAIMLISFITAFVAQFFAPAEAASIPYIVKKEQLEQANTLFLFTSFATVLGGYALAGPIIQVFGGLGKYGDQAAFLLSSSLTAAGFIFLSSLQEINTHTPRVNTHTLLSKATVLSREVLEEARSNIKISLPIFLLTVLSFNLGLLAILSIEFVRNQLQLPTTATSLILITPLVIGVPGGFYLLRLTEKRWRNRGKSILSALLVFGLVLTTLGISGEVARDYHLSLMLLRCITIIGAGLIGISSVFVAVHSRTVLQEETPKHMLGRVFALVTVAGAAVTPIPILLLSFFTEKVSVTWVFMFFGALLILTGLLLAPILKSKLNT